MTLSASQRGELVAEALRPAPVAAIYYLAQLYRRYGRHGALEVTEAIAQATLSSVSYGTQWTEQQFGGFIDGSTTEGFDWKLADPRHDNAQTGHFFSFVVWARDGVSPLEWATVLGHELLPDPFNALFQTPAGVAGAWAFSQIVARVNHDANGTIDYAALTRELAEEGWSTRTLTPWLSNPADISIDAGGRFRVPARVGDPDYYTGNSLQDLRCSVAGLVLGQIIHAGSFANAEGVCAWLERNVLDRSLALAGHPVTALAD